MAIPTGLHLTAQWLPYSATLGQWIVIGPNPNGVVSLVVRMMNRPVWRCNDVGYSRPQPRLGLPRMPDPTPARLQHSG